MYTVQLKGNLIPARVLQVEYCRVKVKLCSIFELAPVMFVPTSGKSSGVCTHKHYIILYELLNEIHNINSIYLMNLRILSLHVLIDP